MPNRAPILALALLGTSASSAQPPAPNPAVQEQPPSWTVRTLEPLDLDGLDPNAHIDKVVVSPVVPVSPEQTPFPYEHLSAQIIVVCRVDGSGQSVDGTVEVITSRPIKLSMATASGVRVDNSDGRFGSNPIVTRWDGPPSIRVDYQSDGQVLETLTMLLNNDVLYWNWGFNPDSGVVENDEVSAQEFTRVARSYGESTLVEMTVSAEYVGNLTFSWPLTGYEAALAELGGCANAESP